MQKKKLTKIDPDDKQCNARTKSNTYCKHPPGFRTDHSGKGRCWLHGGRNIKSGPDHPTFKHGEFSKHFLPKGLIERAQQWEEHEELHQLGDLIAKLRTRINELESKLSSNDSDEWRKRLRDQEKEVSQILEDQTLKPDERNTKFTAAYSELQRLIKEGMREVNAWAGIEKLSKTVGKLISDDIKNNISLETWYSLEQMIASMRTIADVLREELSENPDAHKAIFTRLADLEAVSYERVDSANGDRSASDTDGTAAVQVLSSN